MEQWETVRRVTKEQQLVEVLYDRCGRSTERFTGRRDEKGRVRGTTLRKGERVEVALDVPLQFICAQIDFPNEKARETADVGVVDAQLCPECLRDLVTWVNETKSPDARGIDEGYVELMGS